MVVGKHVYANCRGRDRELLADADFIELVVREAVKRANAELVSIQRFIDPNPERSGVSVVAIVSESHVSVHTWVRERYVTIDAYTCGAHTEPLEAFNYIKEALGLTECEVSYVDRSSANKD